VVHKFVPLRELSETWLISSPFQIRRNKVKHLMKDTRKIKYIYYNRCHGNDVKEANYVTYL